MDLMVTRWDELPQGAIRDDCCSGSLLRGDLLYPFCRGEWLACCGPGSVHRAQSSGSWERHAWGTAGIPAANCMALPSVRVVFEVQKGHSPFTCLSLEAGGCDLSPS